VGIVDPPRPEAKLAIEKAHAAGIQVRMITGDHAVTAEAIARQLGITGRAITGKEFAAMDDATVDREIDTIGVIARVAPEDKVHLVDILKRKGHVVAMTGDGVNDAPALKKADIGVAMGITGTEVSKEAAVMILTDDNFATIVRAVELGRALYDNLVRYIRFQMAACSASSRRSWARACCSSRGHAVPAAPDAVHQLHGPGGTRHRARLRQARPDLMLDAPRSPTSRSCRGDSSSGSSWPDSVMAVGDARDHLVGDAAVRRGRGTDDGRRGLLADQHLVRARDRGRGEVGLQLGDAPEPDAAQGAGIAFLFTSSPPSSGSPTRSSIPST
jgi:soluble P-type ATPase